MTAHVPRKRPFTTVAVDVIRRCGCQGREIAVSVTKVEIAPKIEGIISKED
jgi:hypothetical protein